MLPKGLKKTQEGKTFLELFCLGSRYFVKSGHQWYDYLEELSAVEMQALFSYFASNFPGKDFLSLATKTNEAEINKIAIKAFPKIKLEEFFRLLKLYTYFGNKSPRLEVGCLLFYNQALDAIKFVLPTQKVEPASWNWDVSQDKPLKFLDPTFPGKYTLSSLEENGWEKVGTTHSHHVMRAVWSEGPTGDLANQAGSKNKPLPPNIHILVGQLKDEDEPSSCTKVSVNINGELVDVPLHLVFENTVAPGTSYQDTTWVGEKEAEELVSYLIQRPAVSFRTSFPNSFQLPSYPLNFVKPLIQTKENLIEELKLVLDDLCDLGVDVFDVFLEVLEEYND